MTLKSQILASLKIFQALVSFKKLYLKFPLKLTPLVFILFFWLQPSGQVEILVDKWILKSTRPLDECLKNLTKTPDEIIPDFVHY